MITGTDPNPFEYAGDDEEVIYGRIPAESVAIGPPNCFPGTQAKQSIGGTYFVWAEGTDRIKIGRTTKRLKSRVSELQVGCPYLLIPVALVQYDERRMQQNFHKDRLSGEWFQISGELLSFLATFVIPRFDYARGWKDVEVVNRLLRHFPPPNDDRRHVGCGCAGDQFGYGDDTLNCFDLAAKFDGRDYELEFDESKSDLRSLVKTWYPVES